MKKEERDDLFKAMLELDEDKKDSILAQLFGGFEQIGTLEKRTFFRVLKRKIDEQENKTKK